MIQDYAQAAALLSRAQSDYSAGEYRSSYDVYEKSCELMDLFRNEK